MTALDAVFSALLALSVLWGFWRGVTRELVSMIAWMGIAVLAWRYAGALGQLLPLSAPRIVQVAAGAMLIVLLGVIAAALVGRALRALVAASNLAGTDRVLGAVFGALRGALVLLLITWVVVEGGFSDHRLWRRSVSGPYLEQVWHWMAGNLPRYRVPLVMS